MLEEINNDIENNLIPENRIKYSYKTKILASAIKNRIKVYNVI